ncbi:MoaD/ThiS family protein [Candidatus Woesearchaeota archaeon]|nr:MoaD/ThiS family protein [Candidatus Woesearchaeota archaeon]MBW3014736.1 MoaD/ThiS family protein [Candidatus Woesearchaeota archaeon]
MKIIIKKSGKQEIKQKFSGSGKDLLAKLKINPEEVLLLKNNELVDISEKLSDTDIVEILSVVSGG